MQRPPVLNVPLHDSPFLEEVLRTSDLDEDRRATVRQFAEDGYLVLDLPDLDRAIAGTIAELEGHYPETDRRIAEAWYFCEGVREIACSELVLQTLGLIYGREAIPFQTLNFDRGTQQAAHSDTIHFHCVPARFMCGVWVALEDMDDENGALFVYPGSHRLPDFDMFDLGLPASTESYGDYEERVDAVLRAQGYEKKEVHVRRGQAVVWAANLFHGGSPVRDPARTRHSQATHYYFGDCLYYFPMQSAPFAGKISLREVIDLRTGRFVPHAYRGTEARLQEYTDLLGYPRPLPEWVQDVREEGADEVEGEPEDVRELRRRIRALERTVDQLREDDRTIREDNIEKQRFIEQRDAELAYKIARRITKAGRALMGKRPDAR